MLEGAAAGQSRASPTPGPARCAPSTATTSASSRPISRPIPGKYFTGDGCRRDEDGYYWITGRVDDVHQRLRPPARHRRGRERAGRAPEGRRGRRRRLSARHQGPGHLRLCDADDRRGADRGAAQGAGAVGAQGDRPDRLARPASSSRPACRRPAPARSCAASCARSPRTSSANLGDTSTLADPAVVDDLVNNRQNKKAGAKAAAG